MGDIEERIGSSYLFRVKTEEPVNPKPRDILKFDVSVAVRHWAYYFSRRRLINISTITETTIPVSCESFFENSDDFFESFLSDPLCSSLFIPESLDQISQRIVYWVQQLLEFPSDPQPMDSKCQQEFPLTLAIFVDMLEDGESDEEEGEENEESEVIEESMQQSVTMIPASNEAIHYLKTVTDPMFLKNENCNICMDKFCVEGGTDEDVKLLSMPCSHVFHHQCIVKWLQTSHTCPLCRYPLPIHRD